MNRHRQRGFTLIELMIALVVSSLLAGMILAIFSRMSLAYRGQQQVSELQQVLEAARATIERDAQQAGLAMAQGFKFAGDPPLSPTQPTPRLPVNVVNSNAGPDQIAFFYADPSVQASVRAPAPTPAKWQGGPSVTVDATAGFAEGDLVVLSKATIDAVTNLVSYDACILEIAAGGVIGTDTLVFSTGAPWGRGDSSQCAVPTVGSMIYKFVAHGYRIDPDPARAALGALQGSLTGGLFGTAADNWTDLAYGFTDIQTALQVYDSGMDPKDTLDPDGDGERDWYSGALQDVLTGAATPLLVGDGFLQVSVSLVARTERDVEGIATPATPQLTDPANPDNNPLGDHPSVVLPWAVDPTLPGRIYRSTTFQVDLRNLGVGR